MTRISATRKEKATTKIGKRINVKTSNSDKKYINNATRMEDIGLISLRLDITNAITISNDVIALKQCKVLDVENSVIKKIELELKNTFRDKAINTKRMKTFNKDTLLEIKTFRGKHYLTVNLNRFKFENIVNPEFANDGIVNAKRLDNEVVNDYDEILDCLNLALDKLSSFGISINKDKALVIGTITGENIILENSYRHYNFMIQIIEYVLNGTKKSTRTKNNDISKLQCKLSNKSKITLRDGKANLLIHYAYLDKDKENSNILRLELEKQFPPVKLNEYVEINFDVDRQDYIKTLQVDLAKRFKTFVDNKEKEMKKLVNEGLDIGGANTINDAFKYMLINIHGSKDNFGITDIALVGRVYESMYKSIAPNPKNLSQDFKVLLKSFSPKLVFKYKDTVSQFNTILAQHNLELIDNSIKSKSITKSLNEKINESSILLGKNSKDICSIDVDIDVDELLLPY